MSLAAQDCFRIRALASPDHILVATDLTDTDYLVPHAIAQAKESGASITLIHVIPPSDSLPPESGVIPDLDDAKVDRDVRLILSGLKRQIEEHGLLCDVIYRHGRAEDIIREELDLTGATRLIVGTHGRGKLGQIALGSVANHLLSSVRVPVFAVGPHAQIAGRQTRPRTILHPVSFTGDYIESVRLALDLAQAYRAELTLLHVLDSDVKKSINPARTYIWAEHALRALLPDTDDLMPPARVCVVAGDLVKEILKIAAESEADWIVVGMDGSLPWMRLQNSAAYKVMAEASCPVMALRHAPAEKETANKEESRIAGVIG